MIVIITIIIMYWPNTGHRSATRIGCRGKQAEHNHSQCTYVICMIV